MIRLLPLLVMLSACGVDGPPTPPPQTSTPSGVTISGSVEVGIGRTF